MSTDPVERPLVDDEVQSGVKDYLSRILERATPSSWVAGGTSRPNKFFQTRPRTYKELKRREKIYLNGGPITEFIDTRALMTYGTGVDFESSSPVTDDQGRTVDEWLTEQFGDTLELTMIDAGIQSYWAGDAWPEIVETRAGEFSHLELIDPTTMDVDWNDYGEITTLRQIIKGPRGKPKSQPVDIDNVGHFTFKDSSGGPLGDSLVEQNLDEINRYVSNQEQRANAIKLHGSPKYDVSVGSEGQSIPDKVMRRINRKFRPERVDEETAWTHGGDLEINALESPGMGDGMKQITETDISLLAGSFGIPLEWTNFGSAGLGDGSPAESRERKFERQARTEQTRRANQFKKEILRPILRRYSPFPEDIEINVVFGDVVSDPTQVTEWLSTVDWAFHRDEIREMVGHAAWDESDSREAPPELADDAGGDGGGMGLFSDGDRDRGHGTGNRNCGRALFHDSVSGDDLTQEELVWRDVVEKVLWSDDSSRTLFEFNADDLPDFVTARLEDAHPGGDQRLIAADTRRRADRLPRERPPGRPRVRVPRLVAEPHHGPHPGHPRRRSR
ncbi:hypothetical protein HALLA_12045 [Halostagnicola larsenii XH-48]|uniref:Portal protein n=1 Tax=Halostagnicola larsenii XH-48 TaxID=797299 RepID=W0JQF2_9EURY|nr:hypothetical protein [Halostagnicola larsenii]AHG00956.1 hypothetical protein HALLA_12045 [Halostagnicola larsenii XH-48]